ncbi:MULTISPECIES: S8 family peptidase [Salimicrobium]|uniref:Peptidase S8 n=1 Tax=Salimicrobium humidisoli TaxID=2029857 RepID=A0ABX4HN87_9BACI|nr:MULTISPECIES: S8 family peptidase [Salimicrobium]PBB04658.1 peptidase S8 [Salimicrobium humidisoli]
MTTKINTPQIKVEEKFHKKPYGVTRMHAPAIWKDAHQGEGVVNAIIDSGCDITHPDLRENIIDVRNFTDTGTKSDVQDSDIHGTHVSGIVAAKDDRKGMVGIAPKSKLLILKVLGEGRNSGNYQSLVEAIDYAIRWRGPNNEKVATLNLSLGGQKNDADLHRAIRKAYQNGMVSVAASGNDGDGRRSTSEIFYPGFYKEVLQIGAMTRNDQVAHYSNTNKNIDYVAPGTNIFSTIPNGEYAQLTGTSMAVPQITGAISLVHRLLKEKDQKISIPNVLTTLNKCTVLTKQGDRIVSFA